MFREGAVPCQHCKAGLHRVCSQPVKIPTLMAYVKGREGTTSETMMCCDRKEFWTTQVFE